MSLTSIAAPYVHEAILRIINGETVGLLIDVGAGNGSLSLRLKERGFEVVAVDLNSKAFIPKNTVDFIVADGRRLPLPDQRATYIVAAEVIEHLDNPYDLVKEAYRVLRPGGKLIISTPNVENLFERVIYLFQGRFRWFKNVNAKGGHLVPVFSWSLIAFAESMGFKLESVTYNAAFIPFLGKVFRLKSGRIRIRFKPFLNRLLGEIAVYKFKKL